MDEITQGTEALRKDIAAVGNRVVNIPQNERCAKCGEPVAQLADSSSTASGLEKFYVFPCGHVFKTTCLVDILCQLSVEATRNSIQSLCGKIPFLSQKQPKFFEQTSESAEECCRKLDQILGQACPFCGDLLVKSISKPFITELEYENGEVASWKLN